MRVVGAASLAVITAALLTACGPSDAPSPKVPGTFRGGAGSGADRVAGTMRHLDPVAAAGSFAPNLAVQGESLLATWLEPHLTESAEEGHELRFARWSNNTWSEPVVVASGTDFFANWADIPSVAVSGDGSLIAHWLAMTAEGTYAYSIFLARSEDGGRTWQPLGRLNDDPSPTEHGFVSFVPEGSALRAFWLDGRQMAQEGPMSLRTAMITETVGSSDLVDDRTCDCCSTDAVMTSTGPRVFYRDRSLEEVRDIKIAGLVDDAWSVGTDLNEDGWIIAGCPVNGPAAQVLGPTLGVAWFSAADARPVVKVAFSQDMGETFAPPIEIDDQTPLGRVDLVLDDTGDALVSWLAQADGEGIVSLRRVSPSGNLGEVVPVAHTAAARAAGVPRLVRMGDQIYIAWVEASEGAPSSIRLGSFPIGAIPIPKVPNPKVPGT